MLRILPPDEAKKRARANLAAWKRQKRITESRQVPPRAAHAPEEPSKKGEEQASTIPEEEQWKLDEELIEASRDGILVKVRYLIERGADIDASHKDTPITAAASWGHLEVVRFLIERGADADNCPDDESYFRALTEAAIRGHLEMARLLIENGATVDTRDYECRTPLMFAKTKEMARLLIDNGAEVNYRDGNDMTPLMHHCNEGNLDVVELLLSRGADAAAVTDSKHVGLFHGSRGLTALMFAAGKGEAEIIKMLIDHGADPNHIRRFNRIFGHTNDVEEIRTALIYASEKGHTEAARTLLENGAEVDICDELGRTALFFAAGRAPKELLELLIAHGADVDAGYDGNSPLSNALLNNKVDNIELLRKHGALERGSW